MSKKAANQFACSRLILPEHREELRKHYQAARERETCRRPCLDPQQWETFEALLTQSLERGSAVTLTVSGRSGCYCLTGRVTGADPHRNEITLTLPEGVQRIALPEIIEVGFPSDVPIGFPTANADPAGKRDE